MEFNFEQQPGLHRCNPGLVNTGKPIISVITPYYNGGKHIQQTCNCVLDQTFPYFEWIIVDDGSTTEQDLRILEEISCIDPRIRVFHKENGGIASARNFGIRQSAADYIFPLDCDDLIEPTILEYCWWMLEKHPDAAWAYTDSVGFSGQEYLWEKRFDPEEEKRNNLLTATALIRKSVLESIGLYFEGNRHYNEDWYAWLKILAKGGYPVQSSSEFLFWYRRSDTGVLSIVKNDTKIAKENELLIESAADEIHNPHMPIIYPSQFRYSWTDPKMSQWDRCVFKDKQKKQILFLLPHLEMGGADKFNLDLLEGLDPHRFRAGIITTVPSPNNWQQRFRKLTPDIFNLPHFLDPEDFAEFITYYIKSRHVDILFVSNSYHGYYLIPWLRENFPDLVIVDYVHMEEWYWRNGGYARVSGLVGAITEKTYVCNNATRRVMVSHFGRDPKMVETVHIGVNESSFCRSQVEFGSLYQKLNISEDRPVILFICRMHPQKRPFLMLEIAKRISLKVPQAAFAVVGGGPQEEEMKNFVQDNGLQNTVYFLGKQRDVRPFYRDARLTLVCSLKEGLSLTAYESCSMGVPVVSADVGGQGDLIDDSVGALIPCSQSEAEGLDARQFPEEEVCAYVDAILELLEDPDAWKEKAENCRNRIVSDFTISNMVDYFNKEFERLLSDPEERARRHRMAQALACCSPMAAGFYAAEMQMQSMEDAIAGGPFQPETISDKIRRVYRDEGFWILLKKGIRVIFRKIKCRIQK